MEISTIAGPLVNSKSSQPIEEVERSRKATESAAEDFVPAAESDISPEELVNQIKSLADNSLYAVRFENNDVIDQMVVKVVDRDTDEIIRQIPPEELIDIRKNLQEIRGGIIDTVS